MTGDPTAGGGGGRLEPSQRLTAHQAFYAFGLGGIGAMLLSGAMNFAIAYGEYIARTKTLEVI